MQGQLCTGTRETLTRTVIAVKSDPISRLVKWRAVRRESEGVIVPKKRGKLRGGKDVHKHNAPLCSRVSKGGKCE